MQARLFYIYWSLANPPSISAFSHALAKPVSLLPNGSETIVMYPTTQYVWGPDRVLAKIDVLTGNTCYYLYNGHGDVVQIVDTSGNIVNQYDYDVWGNFLKKEETIQNHFTYFGQTYDEATGLYYLRARYYDSSTGRFTQQDTAEDGYNWYIYGNQNPIMYADSEGEAASWVAIGGAVAACVVDGLITGGIYKWNGKAFGAGFINGFISCLGTEIGVAVGVATGTPAGTYAGTIIGNCIGSAAGSLAEDLTYNKNKSAEEMAKSAAQSAATGIIAGVGSSYFKYAIDLANEAGSAAKTLMQYDERFGKALQVFFDELATILGAQ